MMIKTLNTLKTMLKTSYDMSGIIDEYTGKFKKKSIKNWIIIIASFIVICLSYVIIGFFKEVGIQDIFLDLFFMILNILVLLQAIILTINIIYFDNNITNYIYMPLSSTELMIAKFGVALSVIFGAELFIAIPSMLIYGARTIQNVLFYPISIIVILLTTIFLTSIIVIIVSFLIKLFKFIKKKNIYQDIILTTATLLILVPIGISLKDIQTEIKNLDSIIYEKDNEDTENTILKDEINKITCKIFKLNKILVIPDIGIKAISELNLMSFLYIMEIITIDVILFSIIILIGNKTYLKNVLHIISMFNEKKIKKINLSKRLKHRKKEITYLKNEFKTLLINKIFFMNYIYNVLIIILILSTFTIILSQVVKQVMELNSELNLTFDFEIFSIIIGITQILFTFSSASLISFSRYGRNAVFFKFIPIDLRKQFVLKNIPGITINTIIISITTGVIKFIAPSVENVYYIDMFIIAMLLNIIYNYLLVFVDLWRPQTHLESEVNVVKQNENNKIKYIISTIICLILWYIKEVTKNINLNTAIKIEMLVFIIICVILNIIVLANKEKLFKNIN